MRLLRRGTPEQVFIRARICRDADFVGLEQHLRAACSAQEWGGVDWARGFRTLPLQAVVSAEVAWPADVMEE